LIQKERADRNEYRSLLRSDPVVSHSRATHATTLVGVAFGMRFHTDFYSQPFLFATMAPSLEWHFYPYVIFAVDIDRAEESSDVDSGGQKNTRSARW